MRCASIVVECWHGVKPGGRLQNTLALSGKTRYDEHTLFGLTTRRDLRDINERTIRKAVRELRRNETLRDEEEPAQPGHEGCGVWIRRNDDPGNYFAAS
ncbi:MAG: hypothetical protein HC884_19720 [Chloroflexaceae bacterium]|nr:hypothetical protein [Chloroflexaceae bacterium]